MSKYQHEFSRTQPLTDAEMRAQRTLAAASKLLNPNQPVQPSSTEAELMLYMDELRARQSGYGHAGAVLQKQQDKTD